jgi:hypothetical protein
MDSRLKRAGMTADEKYRFQTNFSIVPQVQVNSKLPVIYRKMRKFFVDVPKLISFLEA